MVEETNLDDVIQNWVEQNHTTRKGLADKARIPHSIFTQIKKGVIPEPETLRSLAEVMKIRPAKLFLIAGHLQEADLKLDSVYYSMKDEELFIVTAYRKLSELERIAFRGALKDMLDYERLTSLEYIPKVDPKIKGEETTIVSFLDLYRKQHGITEQLLFNKASISYSIYGQMRRGITSRPETLRNIADAMGIPHALLFLKAGYLQRKDLQVDPAYTLPDDEKSFLDAYRMLSDEPKNIVRRTLRGMLYREEKGYLLPRGEYRRTE